MNRDESGVIPTREHIARNIHAIKWTVKRAAAGYATLKTACDAYALAKKAGRYNQIKRNEGVSSTNIVGRMLRWRLHVKNIESDLWTEVKLLLLTAK